MLGGEALASYAGGSASVVRHRYGKGTAIMAGTEIFRQYVRDEQAAMSALLKAEILASGAAPTARLSGACADVEVSRLSGEGSVVYVLINHSEAERRFRADLREAAGPWLNPETGCVVDFSREIALPGLGVLAVHLDR